MTIDEVITQLQALKEKHGNIEAMVWDIVIDMPVDIKYINDYDTSRQPDGDMPVKKVIVIGDGYLKGWLE